MTVKTKGYGKITRVVLFVICDWLRKQYAESYFFDQLQIIHYAEYVD